ncbi:MAG TPA: hypothetical protein ENH65_10035 [Candidatus Aminicenantes bacterium]|nr:hypothetical protein [Candidatus Aminicenantes bacterium]
MRQVKCNGCGFIGNEDEFKKGQDMFQNSFIAGCPKCENRQSRGDASMRMFGGDRPFSFIDRAEKPGNPLGIVLHNSDEAS